MKTSLEHLPQRELVRIVGIVQGKFADLVARSTSDARRDGRIFKIILFGSWAKISSAQGDGGIMNHRVQPPLTIAMSISS